MTTQTNRDIEPLPLAHASVDEYCGAVAAARNIPFWWYFGTYPLMGNYSVPFQTSDRSWWYQVKPGLCWPVEFMVSRNHRPSLPLRHSFLGYQSPQHSGTNSRVVFNMIEDLTQFDIGCLDKSKPRALRKASRRCVVEILQTLNSTIEMQATDVWNSLVERSGWNHPLNPRTLTDSWRRLLDLPGTTILGCFDSNDHRLIAWLICKLIGNVAYIDTIASHSSYMDHRPNDLLIYSFLMSAKKNSHISMAHYSLRSRIASLERFKESMGFRPCSIPVYTHLRPGVKALLKTLSKRNFERLMGNR